MLLGNDLAHLLRKRYHPRASIGNSGIARFAWTRRPSFSTVSCRSQAILGVTAVAHAEPPLVVFDLPLTVECRDVTPQRYEASYQRKIFEAIIKISPELAAGEEKNLSKLHYEISTDQQMPIVSFAPSSQVTSDIANGAISIQTDDHHGQLLVHSLSRLRRATGN